MIQADVDLVLDQLDDLRWWMMNTGQGNLRILNWRAWAGSIAGVLRDELMDLSYGLVHCSLVHSLDADVEGPVIR